MKAKIPVFLLVSIGLYLSAIGVDTIMAALFMFAASIVLAIIAVGLLFKTKDHLLTYTTGIAVLLLGAWTHFPLRMTFSLSKSSLQNIAERMRADHPVSFPTRAGIFTIQDGGQKTDGSVYLWTDTAPGGPTGFVSRYTGGGYNIWSQTRLADDWHFISED